MATPARPQGIGTFTTFDVPGAGTGMLEGTGGVSINAAGDIAGIYLDASLVAHGFVRAAGGTITKFDAPNAGTGATQGTLPMGINAAGDIAGTYFDTSNVYHGFVRAADGTITEFDVPGAGTAGHRGTFPTSIDTAGDITGIFNDNDAVRHGFVRAANGTITVFDVPGAGTATRQGTIPLSINAAGDIAGLYLDTNNVYHGFARAADGTITVFDVPGAGTSSGQGTFSLSINAGGDITGVYTDTSPPKHSVVVAAHAFVRAANGTITTFDAPGVGTGTGVTTGTIAISINTAGVITGGYSDANGVLHGFVRAANGTIIDPIDAPGAGTAGTSLFPGTGGVSINDSGVIAGTYVDANGVLHGFALTTTPVAVSPGALTFGNQVVGTPSASQPVTLSNTGTTTLTIASITASGDFAQTNTCAGSVAASGSCTINVTFMPPAAGSRKGSITITDSALGSPQVVSLIGMGTVVELSPAVLSFPLQQIGTTSSPRVVTLTNTGNTSLQISGISTAPAGVGAVFAETNKCGASVAAGASCTISVTFSPRTPGLTKGTLSVSDTGGGSPQSVSLAGTGM